MEGRNTAQREIKRVHRSAFESSPGGDEAQGRAGRVVSFIATSLL